MCGFTRQRRHHKSQVPDKEDDSRYRGSSEGARRRPGPVGSVHARRSDAGGLRPDQSHAPTAAAASVYVPSGLSLPHPALYNEPLSG